MPRLRPLVLLSGKAARFASGPRPRDYSPILLNAQQITSSGESTVSGAFR